MSGSLTSGMVISRIGRLLDGMFADGHGRRRRVTPRPAGRGAGLQAHRKVKRM
jgi:hypothetical protein